MLDAQFSQRTHPLDIMEQFTHDVDCSQLVSYGFLESASRNIQYNAVQDSQAKVHQIQFRRMVVKN